MNTTERILQAKIDDDGSVHYSSVMSPSDNSIAVCHMVPDHYIPVIFVPGVMGTNLRSNSEPPTPVWLVNSQSRVVWDWAGRGSERRKSLLDPQATDVYTDGELPSGTNLTDDELKRRGWGEVANMSYGPFFKTLQSALDDVGAWKSGQRANLMKEATVEPLGVAPLTLKEIASSYRYQLPLHAVGYNWLGSNTDSAQRLQQKIDEFKNY